MQDREKQQVLKIVNNQQIYNIKKASKIKETSNIKKFYVQTHILGGE